MLDQISITSLPTVFQLHSIKKYPMSELNLEAISKLRSEKKKKKEKMLKGKNNHRVCFCPFYTALFIYV